MNREMVDAVRMDYSSDCACVGKASDANGNVPGLNKDIANTKDVLSRDDILKIAKKELVKYKNRVGEKVLSVLDKVALKDKLLKLTKNIRSILSIITIPLDIACFIFPVVALASTIVSVAALVINLGMLTALYFISDRDKSLLVSMAGVAMCIATTFWPANLIGKAISFIGSCMNFCGFLSYTWSSKKKQKTDAKTHEKENKEVVCGN